MLVALKKTLMDVGAFFIILLIFMLPYGIMQQSTVLPNSVEDQSLEKLAASLLRAFFKPYFQLYGEIFVSESTNYDYEQIDYCVHVLADVD